MARLQSHCEVRKYSTRSRSWFGVSIGSDGQIHAAIANDSPCEQSDEVGELTSRLVEGKGWRTALHQFARDAQKAKVGRNSLRTCGSGRKYKNCCLAAERR